MRHRHISPGVQGLLFIAALSTALSNLCAQDPGWPRQISKPQGKFVYYQPQVDEWKDFQTFTWRAAFTLTPTGGKQVVGAATLEGTTNVDTSNHQVVVYDLKVLNTYFPSTDPDTTAKMDQLARTFLPPTVTVSLDRLVASAQKPATVPTVELRNDPPFIFVSYKPAILLSVDGDPVLADVPNTSLKFVVNTRWPLFFAQSESTYYLLVNKTWLSATDLHGPWAVTTKMHRDMDKLPKDPQWESLKSVIPPKKTSDPIPTVFYSTVPAEVILFSGPPVYAAIPPTQLTYATNTDSPVFFYQPTGEYFYLAAGRWFRSNNLEGTWTFASLNLPADFANIPPSSPAGAILASVPGTDEAKDAVLIARIPTVMVVNPTAAAAQVKVEYTGAPQFIPIQGTSLSYATNTADKVIQVGDVYYLCLQGIWFMSTTAQGPWTTATSVPPAIYTIPPSSPVYNVTYVTQNVVAGGDVQSSYTAGYLGAFVVGAAVGAIVASGTGYYYPGYIGYPIGGYPYYRPYPTAYGATGYYNSRTGAYGVSQTAYGPYGAANRTASYNPYTGTATRTASVATPYGSRSVGQAYNPYTGNYAATRQGSSPTAQWGQSVVSNGNQSAVTQHYSNSRGTVATAQGSEGGKAIATSTAFGNTAAGKTSNGGMYAGHDGNVYKNTGGSWQKYDNGGWNSVNTQQAQQRAQGAEQQHGFSGSGSSSFDQDFKNRQSGGFQSQRFDGGQHSFGGWGGGGRSWGGGGGFGGGRFGGRR